MGAFGSEGRQFAARRRSHRWSLLAVFLCTTPLLADDLRDFTTDGCSLFPDGSPVQKELWCDCCVAHDMAYWRGGTRDERQQADQTLHDCVLQRTGNHGLADLVYAGVRTGGHPVFPTWYRWGYGWKYGRGYAVLTEEERVLVEERLAAYRLAHPDFTCVTPRAPEVSDTSRDGKELHEGESVGSP